MFRGKDEIHVQRIMFRGKTCTTIFLPSCSDEVVSCSFNEIGCEKKMKCRCLQQHNEANLMQHQLMMYDAFKNVKKENDVLKDDI